VTLSIAGRCSQTGMLGMAIASSSICVASRCCWARAGVGAVLTQNLTDPAIGQRGLDLLAQGLSATETINQVVEENRSPAYRQMAVIDTKGRTASHTGERAFPICASEAGDDCVAIGNLLANTMIPQEMILAFQDSQDHPLPTRLISALARGLESGGEVSPVRSAGLLVVDRQPWPLMDLRVDWHESPLIALQGLWEKYEPQMDQFDLWALSPDQSAHVSSPNSNTINSP
jgi:uncharacterized Ntn-hydrolase superfamily protein